MSRELIDVEVEIIAQTDKAVRVSDGKTECWLPLSQIEIDKPRYADMPTIITMPERLAIEKGLA